MQHQKLFEAVECRIIRMRSTKVSYPVLPHIVCRCYATCPEASAHGLHNDGIANDDEEGCRHSRSVLNRHGARQE